MALALNNLKRVDMPLNKETKSNPNPLLGSKSMEDGPLRPEEMVSQQTSTRPDPKPESNTADRGWGEFHNREDYSPGINSNKSSLQSASWVP